jgi:hypothetical protein
MPSCQAACCLYPEYARFILSRGARPRAEPDLGNPPDLAHTHLLGKYNMPEILRCAGLKTRISSPKLSQSSASIPLTQMQILKEECKRNRLVMLQSCSRPRYEVVSLPRFPSDRSRLRWNVLHVQCSSQQRKVLVFQHRFCLSSGSLHTNQAELLLGQMELTAELWPRIPSRIIQHGLQTCQRGLRDESAQHSTERCGTLSLPPVVLLLIP